MTTRMLAGVNPAATEGSRAEQARRKLDERSAVIGIIGLGYVGLPMALAATTAGFRVIGFDIDPERVVQLNGGQSPIRHISHQAIAGVRESERFVATADYARAASADVLVICVPTPLGRHREPDLSYVESTASRLAPHLRPGHLIVLESTTWPGTTREIVRPIVEASGLVSERELFIAYSPEREDPGNHRWQTRTIPKIVGGDGPEALSLACMFYGSIVERVVPVSTTDTAEAVKLVENIFRTVNIALVNELKTVFTAMSIDVWEVIEAASTKPFGFMPFHPGPGLGGHCIPIDPFYLTWKAKEFGLSTRFIELAGEVNSAMPAWVIERLGRALDERTGMGLNGARILIVGLAYKKNVDDMRESPALVIIEQLEGRGAVVVYHDPYLPVIPPSRAHAALAGRRSEPLDPEVLERQDAVVVVTDHDGIDWERLVVGSRLVIDTRNATRDVACCRDRIVAA